MNQRFTRKIMTQAASISKDEILKVCSALKAFEKRHGASEVERVARRLRANLEIAARSPFPGFGFVLAEQVEHLRQEAARRD
jgi:hypothetical protein